MVSKQHLYWWFIYLFLFFCCDFVFIVFNIPHFLIHPILTLWLPTRLSRSFIFLRSGSTHRHCYSYSLCYFGCQVLFYLQTKLDLSKLIAEFRPIFFQNFGCHNTERTRSAIRKLCFSLRRTFHCSIFRPLFCAFRYWRMVLFTVREVCLHNLHTSALPSTQPWEQLPWFCFAGYGFELVWSKWRVQKENLKSFSRLFKSSF